MITRERLLRYLQDGTEVKGPEECWPWTRSINMANGRPNMNIQNTPYNAHHVSYYLRHNVWPAEGIFVCHHCDQPLCMNPAHYFLGTNTDNIRDASRKGRMIGVNADRQHVLEGLGGQIKDLYTSGLFTQGSIAEIYGVTRQSINMICCGRRRASESYAVLRPE